MPEQRKSAPTRTANVEQPSYQGREGCPVVLALSGKGAWRVIAEEIQPPPSAGSLLRSGHLLLLAQQTEAEAPSPRRGMPGASA
jgi:hypothetical protein